MYYGRRITREEEIPCELKAVAFVCKTIANFIGSLFTVFLLWLIYFHPYSVRPHVDAAALSLFECDIVSPTAASNVLRYDLAADLGFFNDHFIFGIHFDHLTAALYYNGTQLGPSDGTLPSFRLAPRRRRTVHAALHGHPANVSEAVAEAFARERGEGRFGVDVRVRTTLTYMFWPVRKEYYYEYDCWLQFPVPPNNGTAAVSGGAECSPGRKMI